MPVFPKLSPSNIKSSVSTFPSPLASATRSSTNGKPIDRDSPGPNRSPLPAACSDRSKLVADNSSKGSPCESKLSQPVGDKLTPAIEYASNMTELEGEALTSDAAPPGASCKT